MYDSKVVLLVFGSIFGLLIAVVIVFTGIQQGIISKSDFDHK